MGTATEYTLRQIRDALQGQDVWATEGVTQIFGWNSAQGIEKTLYTVPAGKTAYLTAICLSVWNSDTSANGNSINIRDAEDSLETKWSLPVAPTSSNNITLSFPVPVKLASGWRITLDSGNSLSLAYGSITGYELPE